MDTDKVNSWLALGANIGVLVGLVVLIVEVRQTASLTRADLEAQNSLGILALESNLMEDHASEVWAKSIEVPHSLSLAEIRVLDAHLSSVVQLWHQLMKMEEEGLVSKGRVERAVRNLAPVHFGSQFSQNWWSHAKSGWSDTGVIEIANPIINGISPDESANYVDSLRIVPSEEAE